MRTLPSRSSWQSICPGSIWITSTGWISYDADSGKVAFSLADAAAYRTAGAAKAMPAFDVMDYGQEDYVFGSAESDARHWDKYVLQAMEEHADTLKELFNAGQDSQLLQETEGCRPDMLRRAGFRFSGSSENRMTGEAPWVYNGQERWTCNWEYDRPAGSCRQVFMKWR